MTRQRIVQDFEVILQFEDEGGYHISCPALKGCHSYGDTKEEALKNIKEAIELWLESAQELGIGIPKREIVSVERR